MKYCNKEKIVVFFDGTIDRNRAAHIIKIYKILSNIFKHIVIVISRITPEAYADIRKNIDLNSKHTILVLDWSKMSTKRYFLLNEWILYVIQLLRLVSMKIVNRNSIFLLMGTLNLPALLFGLLLNNRVYTFAGGFAYLANLRLLNTSTLFHKIFIYLKSYVTKIIEFIVIFISSYVILESKNMRKYIPFFLIFKHFINKKVIDYGALYVDTNLFKIAVPVTSRDSIGYIGSLEPYRSTVELVYVFKILARILPNIKFILVGSGTLYDTIVSIVNNDSLLKSRIEVRKYISHSEMPIYLNKIKIFFFPSLSDGLPNTLLESMASGNIIIATPVGGIPDIISNGINGFLLYNGISVLNLVSLTLRVLSLSYHELENISRNAQATIEKFYTFNATIVRWKQIFCI
jgi:glycosyltransferase involved in cell wall biosynthesis